MLQKLDGITLVVFKYYNKTENFIGTTELAKIEKDIETKHYLFYTTEEYGKNGIIFCFYKKYETIVKDGKEEKIPTTMVCIFKYLIKMKLKQKTVCFQLNLTKTFYL